MRNARPVAVAGALLVLGVIVGFGLLAAAGVWAAVGQPDPGSGPWWMLAAGCALLSILVLVAAALIGPRLQIWRDQARRNSQRLQSIASNDSSTRKAIRDLGRRVEAASKQNDRGLQRGLTDLSLQIEGLHSLYATLDLRDGLPSMRNSAISPDLGAHLVRYTVAARPSVVVEAGSGVSTLLIALALERNGGGSVVALEHDINYFEETGALLAQYGVGHRAELVHAPLRPYDIGGEQMLWYDLSAVEFDGPISLLLVDGPPKSVGPMSRLPAVPLLLDHLDEHSVVLLDDAKRPDEQTIADRWCDDYGMIVTQKLRHERGTIELKRRPSG